MSDGANDGIRYPWPEPPAQGEAIEIASGVLWIRLPLPMALDHVNVYALDDGDSWTIVDTGVQSRKSIQIWQELLAGPLAGKPVGRIILTHHHPDHVGMVGWFMAQFEAELLTSRTAWLMSRMLILDVEETTTRQSIDFWQRAGLPPEMLEMRKNDRPFNFADICHEIPVGYTRLKQNDILTAGGRDWQVHMGNGHAPEHVTLWSQDDNLVLAGDQILPSISPNIGVYATEPEADPLGDWLESCVHFARLGDAQHLVLGGHKLPFTGVPLRMHQLIENHKSALRRLETHLEAPKVATECFTPLFKRKIDEGVYGLALVETIAHLNHLYQEGRISRKLRDDGAWLWYREG